VHLGPIDVAASGFAGIYNDANPGIVLRLAVSLDVNVLEIIKINASGELRLNTTNVESKCKRRHDRRRLIPVVAERLDQDPRGHQTFREL